MASREPEPTVTEPQRVHLAARGSGRRFTALVCRGCCCGTERKHPDVDHDAQLAALEAAARAGGGHCRVVDCIDECWASNVVAVRRSGAHTPTVWLGGVLANEHTAVVARWLAQGAAGSPPEAVQPFVIQRRKAQALPD